MKWPSGPKASTLKFILFLFCLLNLFTILFAKTPIADAYCDPPKPPGQIDQATLRDYVKGTQGIVSGVSDGILEDALSKYPSFNAGVSFLDMFKFFLVADEVFCSFNQGDWQHGLGTAASYGTELAIGQTIVGDVLTSPLAIADLVALPIQWSLTYFENQEITAAWNNQVRLYVRYRQLGYSYQDALNKVSKDTDVILFTDDGWLYVVDDQQISSYGAVRPGNYSPAQVYGAAEGEYLAYTVANSYMGDKSKLVEDFNKAIYVLGPQAAFSANPSSGKVPLVVNFDASASTPSQQGSGITNYHWQIQDFDGNHVFDGSSPYQDYQFNQPGSFIVSLTVTEDTGTASSAIQSTIQVASPVHAKFSFSPPHPDAGEIVTFDGSNSYDEQGDIVDYYWIFGDGQSASSPVVTKAFSIDGIYQVSLTAAGSSGYNDTNLKTITVGQGGPVYVPGHSVYGNETWYSGGTYIVQGSITVAPGATLTIQNGVQAQMFPGVTISVSGTLTATGVHFTWADGQSLWGGIWIQGPGASGSRLESCVIEHATGLNMQGGSSIIDIVDGASPTITGCTINSSNNMDGIRIRASSPVISNNAISGMSECAVNAFYSSSPTVTGNTLTGNSRGIWIDNVSNGIYQGNTIKDNTYGIQAIYASNGPIISGNTFSNNVEGDLYVSGIIQTSISWGETGDAVYRTSGLTIAEGASLTIASGRTVKIDGGTSISVSGTLTATGVHFTWADGQSLWGGIWIQGPGASGSRLESCVIEHATGLNMQGGLRLST